MSTIPNGNGGSGGNTKKEFALVYRPRTLDEVVGQPDAVETIRGWNGDAPHAQLYFGMPGVGKTTLARVVARMLKCPPENRMDFQEVNCASVDKPLEFVKEAQASMHASPMVAPVRVYILDELQSWQKSGYASQALLKMLEDGPAHVYWLLCTTDPSKIIPAVRSRCTKIALKPIPPKDMAALLRRVAKDEGEAVADEVVDRVVDAAAGCARDALNELQKALGIADPAKRLAAVGKSGAQASAFELVQALCFYGGSPDWKKAARVLEMIKDRDEEPEGVRLMLLAAARTALVKKGDQNAYRAIRCLDEPLYIAGAAHALLAAAVYQICHSGNGGK